MVIKTLTKPSPLFDTKPVILTVTFAKSGDRYWRLIHQEFNSYIYVAIYLLPL